MELTLADWPNVQLMLALGAILCATYLLFRRVMGDDRKWAPGFPSLPVIGSMPWMTGDIKQVADFSMSPENQYGKIWSFYLGSKYDAFLFAIIDQRLCKVIQTYIEQEAKLSLG